MAIKIKLEFKTYKYLNPSVHLYLGNHGVSKDGRHYLTAECKSESELDTCIDLLIKDLNEARTKVRSKFKEYYRKTKNSQ